MLGCVCALSLLYWQVQVGDRAFGPALYFGVAGVWEASLPWPLIPAIPTSALFRPPLLRENTGGPRCTNNSLAIGQEPNLFGRSFLRLSFSTTKEMDEANIFLFSHGHFCSIQRAQRLRRSFSQSGVRQLSQRRRRGSQYYTDLSSTSSSSLSGLDLIVKASRTKG